MYIKTYGATTIDTDEHAIVLAAIKARNMPAAVAACTGLFEQLVAVYEAQEAARAQ